MGDDVALGVGDDIIRHAAQAQRGDDGIVPHPLVADVAPHDGVAVHQAAALAGIGIETDAHDAQARDTLLALQALELALDVLTLEIPRRPRGDDIHRGIEIAVGDGMALDVDGRELRQRAIASDALEALQMAHEHGHLFVVGLCLADGLSQDVGLAVVGRGREEKITAEEVDAGE